jgi:uncharacterized protein YecE (DUF72 family)
MTHGKIRVGIGGWTYEPWRDGVFFPEKWPQARELEYASRKLTAIEVNGTYYSGFKPATFAKWRDETPEGFVFTLKASRFCTNRKVLADAGESVGKFVGQGISELGGKLGAILWQFMATKKFDAADMAAFLKLLPNGVDGVPLKHAIEVRHESFHHPDFVAMCRDANAAIVFADSAKYPALADVTADFVYARLEDAKAEVETGYTADELDQWAKVAKSWAEGHQPDGLTYADRGSHRPGQPRDVFVFMINGAKERAPAAAMALIERV